MPEKSLKELDGSIRSHQGRATHDDILYFVCPVCLPKRHGIAVTWIAPSIHDSGAVWTKTGNTIDDITISPSINCDVPWTNPDTGKVSPSTCKFHGWVKNGKVVW